MLGVPVTFEERDSESWLGHRLNAYEFNKRAGSFSREREENLLGSLPLAVTQWQ